MGRHALVGRGDLRRGTSPFGLETQRQWSDKAIARTTPVVLGLVSIVTLLAWRLSQGVNSSGADGLVP